MCARDVSTRCCPVQMHAAPRDQSVPTITDATELNGFDGIIFGSGTRYGQVSGQMKSFFDSTGGIWMSGAWIGKTAGIFFSTGMETTHAERSRASGQSAAAIEWRACYVLDGS